MEAFTGYDELVSGAQTALLESAVGASTATTVLSAFSQLKDAVGVVRAFVAAALVMPPDALATLSGRMRGTLILCLHRQHASAATHEKRYQRCHLAKNLVCDLTPSSLSLI